MQKSADKVIISIRTVLTKAQKRGKAVGVFMTGNQTLVGEVPAIAVYWYQRYDTTRERDKTICCEMHQIALCHSLFLFDWKIKNQKGRICRIKTCKFIFFWNNKLTSLQL